MTVTVWNKFANAGAGEIARVATPVHTPDPENPEGPPLESITYGEPLARVSAGKWARPHWTDEMRAEPWLQQGVKNFQPGWVVLRDVLVSPALGTDEVRGSLGDTPVVDLVNLTATWTYGVAAKPLAERKAAMRAAATAKFRAVVAAGLVVGGVTVDLSAEGFERLGQAHAALTAGAGPIKAVTVRGGRIDLPNAGACAAVIAAARTYYLGAAETERALYDAIDEAADHAALDLIDVEAGTVDGQGGWPT